MTSEIASSKYFELIVNLFLNLLVHNVIEREIDMEKVQMKPPKIRICLFFMLKYSRITVCIVFPVLSLCQGLLILGPAAFSIQPSKFNLLEFIGGYQTLL